MKRILLLCLALLLLQGVCWAKIEKQVDEFDGSYAYYVDDFWSENHGLVQIITTFNLAFLNSDTIGSPNLILDFTSYDDNWNSPYSIDKTIKMKIDNTVYTWSTSLNSTRSNGSVSLLIHLPDDVYKAFMNTQKDISIRFTYNSLDGYYKKDYTIPYKSVKDAQIMYNTYYKNNPATNDKSIL